MKVFLLANNLHNLYYMPMTKKTEYKKRSILGFFTTSTKKPNYYNCTNKTLWTDSTSKPYIALVLLLVSILSSYILPVFLQLILEQIMPLGSSLDITCIIQVTTGAITLLFQLLILFVFRSHFRNFFKGRFSKVMPSILFLIAMFFAIYISQLVFTLLSEYIIDLSTDSSLSLSLLASNQSVIEAMVRSDYQGLIVLTVIFIAPISEELTYRLALQGVLVKLPKMLRVLISALVFGLIHINLTDGSLIEELAVLPIYVASGFVLAYTYARSESILPGIAIHSIINLIGILGILA